MVDSQCVNFDSRLEFADYSRTLRDLSDESISMVLMLILCSVLLWSPDGAQAHNGSIAITTPVEGIVVDGDLSDWPQNIIRYPLVYDPDEEILYADSTSFVGDFRVGYNAAKNLLYVAVEVSDDSVVPDAGDGEALPWTQDSCELFVELGHSNEKVRPVQFFLRGSTLGVFGRELQESEVTAKAQWEERRWRVEWAIDIGQLSQGAIKIGPDMELGFDIAIVDVDEDVDASIRYISWTAGSEQFLDSNQLGDLLFFAPNFAFENVLSRINAVTLKSRQIAVDRIKDDTTIDAFLLTAALTLALVHLFIYGYYPQNRENLYFAIFAASLGWFTTPYGLEWTPWPDGIRVLFFWGLSICGLRFLYEIFYPHIPKQFKYFTIGIIVWGILMLVLDNFQSSIILILIVFVEMLRVAIKAIFNKRSGAWILGGGFIAMILPPVAFVIPSGIFAFFTEVGIIKEASFLNSSLQIFADRYLEWVLDTPWGILALMLSMSIYLARNVARTNKDLALQLEQVKELSAKALEDERQRVLLEAENERQSQELEEARRLQLSMLPQAVPESPLCEIAWQMETATEVGGDYYDYNLAADGTLTLTLGDATGHGLQSGTIVTATKSLFQSLAGNASIAETFTVMSRSLKDMNLKRMGMAMAMLKLRGNALQVASAGIPPMLLYRAATGVMEEIELEGMPLGLSTAFPYGEREFELASGDTLVLMSDGLPERLNEADEELGYERMQALFVNVVQRTPVEICSAMARGGDEWADGRAQDDDVTLVVLRIK